VSLGRGTPGERQKRLRAFEWSSYPGYAGLRKQFPFVEEDMGLGELRGPRRGERVRYRRFVEEGLTREIENPFEAVRWQAALGDESFLRRVRDRMQGLDKRQRREIASLRHIMPKIDFDTILQGVAEKYDIDRRRLLSRGERGLQARNVAIWLAWEAGDKSLREIGELFGGLDYAAVAQRIRRTRSSPAAADARKLFNRMLNV
jgi:hypothetical protein